MQEDPKLWRLLQSLPYLNATGEVDFHHDRKNETWWIELHEGLAETLEMAPADYALPVIVRRMLQDAYDDGRRDVQRAVADALGISKALYLE